MLYATKEAGAAVGEILSAISQVHRLDSIEITLSQDALTTTLHMGKGKGKAGRPAKHEKPNMADIMQRKVRKTRKYKKHAKGPVEYEYDGQYMTAKDWAKKIGVAENTVRYRMEKYGNPYGRKGPTDGDKVIAGS